MSLPIEIQNVVDKAEAFEASNTVVALFSEYGSDYLDTSSLDYESIYDKWDELMKEVGHEVMESQGGGEGEGEYCYSVIKLGDKFFKAEWSYYSYNGCDFDYIEDTITEVTPKQKTITVYE